MATVSANGLKISHKGSGGTSIATLPDVCKTPTPGGPVPMPYPNVAFSNALANGTKTVKLDGGNMSAIKGSEYRTSIGDEPGTVGGITSNTFKKETAWITYSFDVKFEGQNVCRNTDKKFHNHKNTVDMAGDLEGVDLAVAQIIQECAEAAEAAVNPQAPTDAACKRIVGRDSKGKPIYQQQVWGTQKHEHAEECIDARLKAAGLRDRVSIERPYQDRKGRLHEAGDEGGRSPYLGMKPDIVVHAPQVSSSAFPRPAPPVSAVFDLKFPCPPDKDPHWGARDIEGTKISQRAVYQTSFKTTPRMISPRGIYL